MANREVSHERMLGTERDVENLLTVVHGNGTKENPGLVGDRNRLMLDIYAEDGLMREIKKSRAWQLKVTGGGVVLIFLIELYFKFGIK